MYDPALHSGRDPQGTKSVMRYLGLFRGFVEEVTDPENRGRVRVRVPHVFQDIPTAHLPWAERVFPSGGGENHGSYIPLRGESTPGARDGDNVWVLFEGGDISAPVVVGTWIGYPENSSDLPPEIQAVSGGQLRRHVHKTHHGHRIELGDEKNQHEIKVVSARGDVVHIRESDGGRGIHVTTAEGHKFSMQDEQPGTSGPVVASRHDSIPDRKYFSTGKTTNVPPLPVSAPDGVVQSPTPVAASGFGQKGIMLETSSGHLVHIRDVTNPGMTLRTVDGHKIEVLDAPNTLELVTADGNNRVKITQGSGILIECPGQVITMNAATFTLNASSQFTINTPSFDLNQA